MRRGLLLVTLTTALLAALAPSAGATRVLPATATPMEMRLDVWVATYIRAGLECSPAAETALFTVNGGKCDFPWIDGASIGAGHWVSTPVFPAILAIRNLVFAPPGLWNNLADGYFAIAALSPGRHTIVTESVYNEPREVYGYTYDLTVG